MKQNVDVSFLGGNTWDVQAKRRTALVKAGKSNYPSSWK